MRIKVVSGKPQYLGKAFCYLNRPTDIDDNYVNQVKDAMERGVGIDIYTDGEWITAKKYFNNIKEKTSDMEKASEEDDVLKKGVPKGNDNLEEKSVEELKNIAQNLSIDNYWVMKKETLIQKIKSARE